MRILKKIFSKFSKTDKMKKSAKTKQTKKERTKWYLKQSNLQNNF